MCSVCVYGLEHSSQALRAFCLSNRGYYMPLPSRICVAFSGLYNFQNDSNYFLVDTKKNPAVCVCIHVLVGMEVFHTLLKMILTPMMDEPFSKVIAKNFVLM